MVSADARGDRRVWSGNRGRVSKSVQIGQRTRQLGNALEMVLERRGDRIRLSVAERRLDLLVAEDDLARRRQAAPPGPAVPARGYQRLYHHHVLPADQGCDFDFLKA